MSEVASIKPRVKLKASTMRKYSAAFGRQAQALVDWSSNALQAWTVAFGDADQHNDELPRLAAASYELAKSNPLAIAAVQTWINDTIGDGLHLQCRVDRDFLERTVGLTEEQADAWEMDIERRFQVWANNSYHCDIEGVATFWDMQALNLRSEIIAGDGFAAFPMVQRRNSPFQVRVQLIDGARVCNEHWKPDSLRLSGGIQRDGNGLVTHIHVLTGNPYSTKVDNPLGVWRKLPMRGRNTGRQQVAHTYVAIQPGQSRGLPLLTPVVSIVKQMGRYTDAEAMAAVVNAFFAVLLETPGDDAFAFGADELEDQADLGVDVAGGEIGLSSGAYLELPPGSKPHTVAPGRPNPSFDAFMKSMMLQISMALGIPIDVMTRTFDKSYTAARASTFLFHKAVRGARARQAIGFSQVAYESWLLEQVASRQVRAPGFFRDPYIKAAWCGSFWVGPPKGMIDPQREVGAEKEMWNMRVKPLADIALELTGNSWEGNIQRIAREQRLMERLGVSPPDAMAAAIAAPSGTEEDDETDDEDES